MKISELIEELTTMKEAHGDVEVMARYVGSYDVGNIDFMVDFVRHDIIGGPFKADERMGVILT